MARRLLSSAIALLLLHAAAPARADVSKPAPGVVLVRHGARALAIADLCAPGVSIRATKYGERKHTPETWASLPGVGASVAVNADFFDFPAATHVNGRARGAGEDWPAAAQFVEYTQLHEVRGYWQFGPSLAAYVNPSTTAPVAGATQIIGAHNAIIRGGKSLAPNFDGDGVILTAERRTGIGVSTDRAKVYLFSSGDAIAGAEMASTMLAYAKEGGAPDIDAATNEDGGGSSQMYVRGLGQIVTSGRLVANHLGIVATGKGDAPMCPNTAPRGVFDAADCEHITGWAQDPDQPTHAVDVHVYIDAPPGTKDVHAFDAGAAATKRDDLCKPLGSCEHAFDIGVPFGIFDGKEHEILVYAIDDRGTKNAQVGSKKVTCSPKPPASVRRPVDDKTFAAWGFDAFVDVLAVDDAALADMKEAAALPAAAELVRGDDGAPEVWLVDGTTRHHVPDRTAARAWHLDLAKVVTKPAKDVAALTEAPPLRSRPWIARTADGATYLLDALPGEGSSPASAGADGGVSSATPADAAAAGDDGCSTSGAGTRGGGIALALVAWAIVRRRRRRLA